MAKSDKPRSRHINPVADELLDPMPPVAAMPPLGGAVALDPVTAGINAVTAALNFGTALVNFMAEKERTAQIEAMVIYEQQRHNNRLAEIREEFKMLQLRLESDEKKREIVAKRADDLHRQVEYCRETLNSVREMAQPDLHQLAAFQQMYQEALRAYAMVSAALAGA